MRYFTILSLVTGINYSLEIELDRTLENYSDDGIKIIDENQKSPLFDEITLYALRII